MPKKGTRTDEQGRFEIDGLDPKLKFRVCSTATGKQTRLTNHVDPAQDAVTIVLPDFPEDIPPQLLIEGTVVSDLGAPISGALLEPAGWKAGNSQTWGGVEAQPAVSDDDGKFKILLTKDYESVFVQIMADGYAGNSQLLAPGTEAHRVVVPKGSSVTGKLTFQGEPQAGVTIAVVQTNRSSSNHFIQAVMAETDRQGRFEFQALPASQEYLIFSPVNSRQDAEEQSAQGLILATKRFGVRGDDETRDIGTLELRPGSTFAGRLEMTDGTPFPERLKLILVRTPAWDWIDVPVDADGHFAIANLPPETYGVHLRAKGVQLDRSQLKYQATDANVFGVHLTDSVTDLLIPLQAEQTPPAPASPAATVDKSQPQEEEPAAVVEPFPDDAESTNVQFVDEPVPANGPRLSVRGTVISAEGEPVPEATIVVRAIDTRGLDRDFLAQTMTDVNGRFDLRKIPIPFRLSEAISNLISGRGGAQVIAFAPGHGLAWVEVPTLNGGEPLRLVLAPVADVRGVVNDEAGAPISDVRITVSGIKSTRGIFDDIYRGSEDLDLRISQLKFTAITDDAGRFALENIPRDRRLLLMVEGACVKPALIALDTGPGGRKLPAEIKARPEPIPLFQSPLAVTRKRLPTVTVYVSDHLDQPVTDGVAAISGPERGMGGRVPLDADGKAVLPLLAPGTCRVGYSPDRLAPRLGVWTSLELGEDGDDVVELRLPEPRWLTGRIVRADTGEALVGKQVQFRSLDPDRKLPIVSWCFSGENGEFRMPVIPGPIRVTADSYYYGLSPERAGPENGVELEVPAEGELPIVTLKSSPGLVIEGTVVNEAGEPAAGVAVRAEQNARPFIAVAALTDEQGRFRASGLSPLAKTVVTARQLATADRRVIDAAPAEDEIHRETVHLQLLPRVQLAGRVMKQGRPVAGVKMELTRSLPAEFNRSELFAVATTDRDGCYLFGGLEEGDVYHFRILTDDGSVAPGWRDSNAIPAGTSGRIELPDAVLVSSNQTLKGRLVDTEGRPVSGYAVSAQLKDGRSMPRRENAPPAWTETNEQGEFELEQLPDEPIELTAYRRNPAGGSIHYPASFQPAQNQTDIRILVDPRLQEDVGLLEE